MSQAIKFYCKYIFGKYFLAIKQLCTKVALRTIFLCQYLFLPIFIFANIYFCQYFSCITMQASFYHIIIKVIKEDSKWNIWKMSFKLQKIVPIVWICIWCLSGNQKQAQEEQRSHGQWIRQPQHPSWCQRSRQTFIFCTPESSNAFIYSDRRPLYWFVKHNMPLGCIVIGNTLLQIILVPLICMY